MYTPYSKIETLYERNLERREDGLRPPSNFMQTEFQKKDALRKRRERRASYRRLGRWDDAGPAAMELRRWLEELKSKPCTDCGHRFPPCCMDFDHRPGSRKCYCIGTMFAHHYGKVLIKRELRKCDLVCSNCHRIRTRDRRLGSGRKYVHSI